MPDATPTYGWPIPVLTDDPNIPADVTALALAAESTIHGVDAAAVSQTDFQASVPSFTVSSLPADGNNGDVVDLLLTYPSSHTIVWRFRYHAGESTAYKWAFVGGPPLFNKRDPEGTIAPGGSNDWQTLSGTDQAGPAVTLPVDAYYDVKFGCQLDSPTNGQIAMAGVSASGSDPNSDDVAASGNTNTASVSGARFPFDGIYTAGTSLRLMYRCSGSGGTAHYSRRWISVLPVRAKP